MQGRGRQGALRRRRHQAPVRVRSCDGLRDGGTPRRVERPGRIGDGVVRRPRLSGQRDKRKNRPRHQGMGVNRSRRRGAQGVDDVVADGGKGQRDGAVRQVQDVVDKVQVGAREVIVGRLMSSGKPPGTTSTRTRKRPGPRKTGRTTRSTAATSGPAPNLKSVSVGAYVTRLRSDANRAATKNTTHSFPETVAVAPASRMA